MISTGSVMSGNSSCSRSSARTSAATVMAGCTSLAVQGSLFRASTAFASREKSSFFSFKTGSRGATWLNPLDGGEGEARSRYLEREAFADESSEFGLVLERVDRRDHAA